MSRIRLLKQNRFLFLLLTLLFLLIVTPILDNFADLTTLLNLFISLTLFSGTITFAARKRNGYLALLLAAPYFIGMWTDNIFINSPFHNISIFSGILFYFYIIGLLLYYVFKQRNVAIELIYAALAGFLLLGIAWSNIYYLIYSIEPSSFTNLDIGHADLRYKLVYFSFITISTLGYGDIIPTNAIAQSWCILEAIIGQIYMVVLVAGLVGGFTNTMNRKD